jgi:Ca-activated chloride channel family protein
VYAVDEVISTAKASGQRMFVVGIGSSPAESPAPALGTGDRGQLRVRGAWRRGGASDPAPVSPHALPGGQWRSGAVARGTGTHAQTECPVAVFEGDAFNLYARFKSIGPAPLTQAIQLWGTLEGESRETCLAELRPDFISDEHNTLARLAAHTRYTQLRQTTDAPAF